MIGVRNKFSGLPAADSLKGNTELLAAVNEVLAQMTVADYEAMMAEAIAVQPLSE